MLRVERLKTKRLFIKFLFWLLLSICFLQPSKAQSIKSVEVDLNSRSFSAVLPFHEPFNLNGKIGENVDSVTLYRVIDYDSFKKQTSRKILLDSGHIEKIGNWKRDESIPNDDRFSIRVGVKKPLESNKEYNFIIVLMRKISDDEQIEVKKRIVQKLTEYTKKKPPFNNMVFNNLESITNDIKSIVKGSIKGDYQYIPPKQGILKKDIKENDDDITEWFHDFKNLLDPLNDIKTTRNNIEEDECRIYRNLKISGESKVKIQKLTEELKTDKHAQLSKFIPLIDKLHKISDLRKSEIISIKSGSKSFFEESNSSDFQTFDGIGGIWDRGILLSRKNNFQRIVFELRTLVIELDEIILDVKKDQKFPDYVETLKSLREKMDLIQSISATINDEYGNLIQAISEHEKSINEFAEKLEFYINSEVYFEGSTKVLDAKTKSNLYVGLDLGLAYIPYYSQNIISPIYGVNIYFVPVNKDVLLSTDLKAEGLTKPSAKKFWRSFSLTTGFTFSDISIENQRKGLIGNAGLLVGLGYRFTDDFRISGGTVLFHMKDPNPIIENYSLGATPYLVLSADLDLFGALGNLTKKIFSGL